MSSGLCGRPHLYCMRFSTRLAANSRAACAQAHGDLIDIEPVSGFEQTPPVPGIWMNLFTHGR